MWCLIMRRITVMLLVLLLALYPCGCTSQVTSVQVAATTAPVYEFAMRICQGTDITVTCLINENVSCLHDYTLQTSQMRTVESAEILLISGAGLEDFLEDIITSSDTVVDASQGISLLHGDEEHAHSEHEHSHTHDPHIWLSPTNSVLMAKNICNGLSEKYPQYASIFSANLDALCSDLYALDQYGKDALSSLSCRDLITFHDGFAYLADAFDLRILYAIEEESGSEASALELIEIAKLINANNLKCIFTESNGSTSAAQILSAETEAKIYSLDMAMGDCDYFTAMYHNIDTIKEALK